MNLLQGSELLRQSAQLGLRVAGLSFEDADEEDDDDNSDGGDTFDARKQLALVKLLLAVGRSQFGHEGMNAVHLGAVGNNVEEILATFDGDSIGEATTVSIEIGG